MKVGERRDSEGKYKKEKAVLREDMRVIQGRERIK